MSFVNIPLGFALTSIKDPRETKLTVSPCFYTSQLKNHMQVMKCELKVQVVVSRSPG